MNILILFPLTFRRDRGIISRSYDTLDAHQNKSFNASYRPAIVIGETTFVYAIPSVIHFFGFVMAVYVYRVADNEHLQNLVERVFIVYPRPGRLLLAMWSFVVAGTVWLMFTQYVVLQELSTTNELRFLWSGKDVALPKRLALIMLAISVFVHDFVQAIVLTSYGIQCYLLRCYLYILKNKLLQNTIDPLDWMRVS